MKTMNGEGKVRSRLSRLLEQIIPINWDVSNLPSSLGRLEDANTSVFSCSTSSSSMTALALNKSLVGVIDLPSKSSSGRPISPLTGVHGKGLLLSPPSELDREVFRPEDWDNSMIR